jgi:hypothetical protein
MNKFVTFSVLYVLCEKSEMSVSGASPYGSAVSATATRWQAAGRPPTMSGAMLRALIVEQQGPCDDQKKAKRQRKTEGAAAISVHRRYFEQSARPLVRNA